MLTDVPREPESLDRHFRAGIARIAQQLFDVTPGQVRALNDQAEGRSATASSWRSSEVIDTYPTRRKKALEGSVPWDWEKNGVKASSTLERPS